MRKVSLNYRPIDYHDRRIVDLLVFAVVQDQRGLQVQIQKRPTVERQDNNV